MPFLSPNQQCQSTEGKNITWLTMYGKGGFFWAKPRSQPKGTGSSAPSQILWDAPVYKQSDLILCDDQSGRGKTFYQL